MSNSELKLSAFVVETNDIRMASDTTTMARNVSEMKRVLGNKTKISGTINNIRGRNGCINVTFTDESGHEHNIDIETTGTATVSAVEELLHSDHCERVTQGGNTFNVINNLQALLVSGLREVPVDVQMHDKKRTILNVPTSVGVLSIGEVFPSKSALQVHKNSPVFTNAKAILCDIPLSQVLDCQKNAGPVPLLNPTSSKWPESGKICTQYGRPPSLLGGIAEIPRFLDGAQQSVEQSEHDFTIHPSIIDDSIPVFTNGNLNPDIAYVISRTGWEFNQLMHDKPSRTPTTPCDLVINWGPGGGAVRKNDLWVFSSTPSKEATRKLGNMVDREQHLPPNTFEEMLTDFENVQDTLGCGDSVAAIQGYANSMAPDAMEKSIVDKAKEDLSREKIEIAEVIFISIWMRMYALLMFHTKGSSLMHLAGKSGTLNSIWNLALHDAVRLAKDIDAQNIGSKNPYSVVSSECGVNIGLWHQNKDFSWPKATPKLAGVVREIDFEESSGKTSFL